MYFAILGKNPTISLAELQIVEPTAIAYPKKGVITFETTHPEKISTLGGVIKAGPVVREKELPEILKDVKIIGIKEIANGKHLKQTVGIRRFKTVDFFHTDKEIKEKGVELINLGNGDYGRVEWYQNIPLYEAIDFEKPARSMEMGMMPAKLAHIMINIGLYSLKSKVLKPLQDKSIKSNEGLDGLDGLYGPSTVIYDPFVGSGTTGFLANALGYDFIGSDINISYAQENVQRRKKHALYNGNLPFDLFQQDVKEPFHSSLVEKKGTMLIISEGRLGPIVTGQSSHAEIQRNQDEVLDLYTSFLQRIKELSTAKGFNSQLSTVITIPYYKTDNYLEKELRRLAEKLGLSLDSIPEVYQRENQNIGRKILIIK